MVLSNNNGGAAITPALGTIGAAFCTLPSTEVAPSEFQGFKQIRYRVETGAGVTAGAFELFELGQDGNWHLVKDVAAVTVSASGVYTGTVQGPFKNLQIQISTALLGGNITYIELNGECSDPVGSVRRGF